MQNCSTSLLNSLSSILNSTSSFLNCTSSILSCTSSFLSCTTSFLSCTTFYISCTTSLMSCTPSSLHLQHALHGVQHQFNNAGLCAHNTKLLNTFRPFWYQNAPKVFNSFLLCAHKPALTWEHVQDIYACYFFDFFKWKISWNKNKFKMEYKSTMISSEHLFLHQNVLMCNK